MIEARKWMSQKKKGKEITVVNEKTIPFPDDFRFQISKEEFCDIVRSQFVISQGGNKFKGQDGGIRYLPWAFTERCWR